MDKIEKVREKAKALLDSDNSGHGMDHSERVLRLSLQFAEAESANTEVVSMAALLHDVAIRCFIKKVSPTQTTACSNSQPKAVDITAI